MPSIPQPDLPVTPVDPALIQRLQAARNPQGTPVTPSPLPAPSTVPGLAERADQAATALQTAQAQLAEVQRQIAAAHTARAQRERALHDYEQQALHAAAAALAGGQAGISDAERMADEQAERLRRELHRADAALEALRQREQEAQQTVAQAQRTADQTQADLARAQVEERGAQLRARAAELVAALQQVIADGRAYNRALVHVIQAQARAYGRPVPDATLARRQVSHLLFLPGADLRPPDGRALAMQGVALRFAPDLTSAETEEDWAQRAMG
jgi:hypothetical protein